MNIYILIILISIIAYVAVGNYAGRRVKNLEDYFVVGRNAPTLLIVGTLVASMLSTNTFMGDAGFVYGFNTGVRIVVPGLYLCGYVYGALFFGRYLRRSRSLTVAEFFANRFYSRRVGVVAAITVVVGIGFYLIAVTQGVALILSNLTPLTYSQAIVVTWLSYTSFTLYSGSRGVVITDTMMFVLFSVVSVVAMVAILDLHGGWPASFEALMNLESKPNLMGWFGMTGEGQIWETPTEFLVWYLIISFGWSFVTAVSPWQSSRFLMARSEHVVLRSAVLAAIFVAVIQAVVFAAASTVNLSNPVIEPREEVMIWASLNMLAPIVGALILAGLVSAGLSSASTFLSLTGFNLSNDIFRKDTEDNHAQLSYSRKLMLVASLVGLGICLSIEQNIFWLTYFAGTLFASAWGPVSLMSIWSDRITASAAFWGILTGFLGNTIPKLLTTFDLITLPVYLDPILVGGVLSLVVVLVVSRFTEVTENEREYRLKLLKTPASEMQQKEANRTLWYAIGMGAFGVGATALLMKFYVLPFQQISNQEAGFRFDWLSGEALGAWTWMLLYGGLGWLMYWMVKRAYVRGQETERVTKNVEVE